MPFDASMFIVTSFDNKLQAVSTILQHPFNKKKLYVLLLADLAVNCITKRCNTCTSHVTLTGTYVSYVTYVILQFIIVKTLSSDWTC